MCSYFFCQMKWLTAMNKSMPSTSVHILQPWERLCTGRIVNKKDHSWQEKRSRLCRQAHVAANHWINAWHGGDRIAFQDVGPAIGFAFQHVMLAASLQGAIVYAVAFTTWGMGSGIIYHKQKRLFPLIVCHFIVNTAFSLVPIVFLILGVFSLG